MTDQAIPTDPLPDDLSIAADELSAVVAASKAILLEHRVRDFQAADVLMLARMILDRVEQEALR